MPKDDFRREVAARLKEARRERTLTQRQLADLGFSTQQNISRYEKGYIPDSWFLLGRLHAEKAIDLNWLLGSFATSSTVPTAIGIADAKPDGAATPAVPQPPTAGLVSASGSPTAPGPRTTRD